MRVCEGACTSPTPPLSHSICPPPALASHLLPSTPWVVRSSFFICKGVQTAQPLLYPPPWTGRARTPQARLPRAESKRSSRDGNERRCAGGGRASSLVAPTAHTTSGACQWRRLRGAGSIPASRGRVGTASRWGTPARCRGPRRGAPIDPPAVAAALFCARPLPASSPSPPTRGGACSEC